MQKTCRHIKTGAVAQYLGSGLANAYQKPVTVHVLVMPNGFIENWIDKFFLEQWVLTP